MRVGVFGGSFDPPHVGHGMVAAWLHWSGLCDEVWLVPTYVHPFAKDLGPFHWRVAMATALADAVGPWVKVEPIEASLAAPSFTVVTLDALSLRHPTHRFRLVMGADNVPDAPKWREWDRVLAQYDPIIVGRLGWPEPGGSPVFPDVASRDVRGRKADGRPYAHLLVPAVARLYDAPDRRGA